MTTNQRLGECISDVSCGNGDRLIQHRSWSGYTPHIPNPFDSEVGFTVEEWFADDVADENKRSAL